MEEKVITLSDEILDSKNMLVMKLLHYFIIDKKYNPIIIQGADNEIWLENLDEDYKVIRIVTENIRNEEQYKFDVFKTKRILKKIKKKTFSFNIKTLNIFLNIDKSIEFVQDKALDSLRAEKEIDIKKNKLINENFSDIKEKLKYTEKGMELFAKITSDINEHNIEDSEKAESIFKPKYPLVTYVLVAINILIYILPVIYGNNFNFFTKFCLYAPYVRDGEYYRLITSSFLHANILHLVCNMYVLFTLGSQLESFIGKFKYTIVYFFSAITASLMSMTFLKDGISVGASGAIFGIMGAMLYFGFHYRVYLGNALKTSLIPAVVLNLILGFTIDGIDNFAHIGGLIGGVLMNIGLGVKYKTSTFEKVNGLIVSFIYLGFLVYTAFIFSR